MSLHGGYDEANIFAKILRGEIPAVTIFEDEVALAFMDLFPQSRGHALVIPKQVKARNFLDLPPEAIGPFLERVQKTARAVEKALKPDGLRILQFNGAASGQTVYHVHFHVLPIYQGVEIAGHAHGKMADAAELKAIAAEIAAAL